MHSSNLRNLKIEAVIKNILLFIALVFFMFIVYFTIRATTPYTTSDSSIFYLSFMFVPAVFIISEYSTISVRSDRGIYF